MKTRPHNGSLTRRTLLWASAAPLWGCTTPPADGLPTALQPSRAAGMDFLALGELHDNPHHHRARADWVLRWQAQAAAGPGASAKGLAVVVEHLPRGASLHWRAQDELLPPLEAQGFDAKGWRWPLHQSLFEGLRQSGCALFGGNLPKALVRRVVREGAAILEPGLQAWIADCPLEPSAMARLQQQLLISHCQSLPAERLPGMVLAQRARDAAMADAMVQAFDAGHRPVVLMAGNGHTRRDWGVPQMLRQRRPQARTLAVALTEDGTTLGANEAAAHDVQWALPAVSRPPVCAT